MWLNSSWGINNCAAKHGCKEVHGRTRKGHQEYAQRWRGDPVRYEQSCIPLRLSHILLLVVGHILLVVVISCPKCVGGLLFGIHEEGSGLIRVVEPG